MGLFQQMRETPERVRSGKFMAAFFKEAPLSIVEAMYTSVGRDALASGLRDLRKQAKEKEGVQIPEGDPGEQMQELLEAWTTGDAVCERIARMVIGQASMYWAATLQPLEMVRAVTAVFREIQSRKYVLDDTFDPEATLKKAMGV
jgi:hypothetical protein